ncbi:MAG: hypothetical protein M5U34_00975 [Chloroflexi bacterium]|nr:hypothetical protein [Chloroflexota bacterium]
MVVNELPLPQLLQELIEKDQWKRPEDIVVLESMTGSKNGKDFTFLDVRGMQLESYPVHLIEDNKLAAIYHLASSKLSGKPIDDDGILDIDKAIFIAVNWSEEAICLDYSLSSSNPRIVTSVINEEDMLSKWKVIAPDFLSFAIQLGMKK